MRTIGLSLVLLVLAVLLASGCAKRVGEGPAQTDPTVPGNQEHILEHEIIAGESLSQIADNYYGNPDRSAEIAAGNGIADPDQVVPGSVLRLHFTPSEWVAAQRRATALVAYNKGVDYFSQDRLAEAEKQFSLALKTAPDLASAKYNLALVHLKRGKHGPALVILESLTEKRPRSTDYRFARGHALFQLTRFAEAAEQFKILTDEHPTHKRGVFSLARSLQEAGRNTAAKAAWRRYLKLDDTSGWADTARRNLKKLG